MSREDQFQDRLRPIVEQRQRIDIATNLYLRTEVTWQSLVEADDPDHPRILVRGSEMCRFSSDGLEPWSLYALREHVAKVVEFGKTNAKGDWVSVDPPTDLVKGLLARSSDEYVGAPSIDSVVDIPVVVADETSPTEKSILYEEGYHQPSRVFFRRSNRQDSRNIDLESIRPLHPDAEYSPEELIWARDLLLDDLLGDFGFADEGSRANSLGLLLLPFVQGFINGPTPLHVIVAPEPGSGKTLLANSLLIPGCGLVPVTPATRDDEEWRKRLTASLLRGERAVIFDNLNHKLESGALAAALTTGSWRDRILGESREVVLPVRNAWVATGNNMQLSEEQVRRSIPIFLDPGDLRPSDRPASSFRHQDLIGWATQYRTTLVQAALTLIGHWVRGQAITRAETGHNEFMRMQEVHGEATDWTPERTLGSYTRWSQVIGGILKAADVQGFLSNRDRLSESSGLDAQEAEAFLRAWRDLGIRPSRLRDIREMCELGGPLRDHLPTWLQGSRQLQRDLQDWLVSKRGARFDGLRICSKKSGPMNVWWVE